MKDVLGKTGEALKHLQALNDVFLEEQNYGIDDGIDYTIYKSSSEKLGEIVDALDFNEQLYGVKARRMILADLLTYILLGRGYYSIKQPQDKANFVKLVLYFVNLLICYEALTVSTKLRRAVLQQLGENNSQIRDEPGYAELQRYEGNVGVAGETTPLDDYFDSLLPKTAGGLWHELLVYTFLLRNNVGHIVPLLLVQRFLGLHSYIIPPDFLVISEKRVYGVEVGRKKEIQSGAFSLQTAIPTASIDTENSRNSDRCPICKKWIPFCDYVIERYSDLDYPITKPEVKCLEECDRFDEQRNDVAEGKCIFTKYRRNKAATKPYACHEYATGLHYHYQCVLANVSIDERSVIVKARDSTALKTHYPYYSGLDELIKKKNQNKSRLKQGSY